MRTLAELFTQPLTHFLFQLLLIVLVSKIFARLIRFGGQPAVIGEMLAGLVLGKSVLGIVAPQWYSLLFPPSSLEHLYLLSQIGPIFFMFVVGLELDLSLLKQRATAALVVSPASILVPFALGAGLARLLHAEYAPPDVPVLPFALFVGIAMSITAFPVLARILQEKAMTKTPVGVLAITCAAIDDVTAWCLLALVVGISRGGNPVDALLIIGMTCLYAVAMIFVLRPWLDRRFAAAARADAPTRITMFFVILIGSAFATELIGIHALFGAFMAGLIMPKDPDLRAGLVARVEDLSSVVLLPLFFAFTGLRTQVGLLHTPTHWIICMVIIMVAIAGKLFASTVAARWTGQRWRDALTIGTLLNTRGLMELVVLNIGYDLGILSPEIFTMLVIMALVTTMMTGPLVSALKPAARRPRRAK